MSNGDPITEAAPVLGAGGGQGRYLRVFKELRRDEITLVEHDLRTQPLVDVYALEPFLAAVSADETVAGAPVHFYLYHREDGTVGRDGTSIVVDDLRDPSFRIPFEDALREVGIRPEGGTHLGDVVVEFWKAFFDEPNDRFGEESYANSPWLDQSVGDRRSVDEVRRGGGWNDLWLMYRPRKTINWPPPRWWGMPLPIAQPARPELGIITQPIVINKPLGEVPKLPGIELDTPLKVAADADGASAMAGFFGAPPGVEVLQLGVNTVGLRLLSGGPERLPVMALLRS